MENRGKPTLIDTKLLLLKKFSGINQLKIDKVNSGEFIRIHFLNKLKKLKNSVMENSKFSFNTSIKTRMSFLFFNDLNIFVYSSTVSQLFLNLINIFGKTFFMKNSDILNLNDKLMVLNNFFS